MLCEQELFLGALDDGGEVDIVSFLELLAGLENRSTVRERYEISCSMPQTHYIRQLRFRHQVLRFGTDELVLELHDLGAVGLFELQSLDLVGYLSAWISSVTFTVSVEQTRLRGWHCSL